MTRWQGEPDPRHVEAIDAYWVSAAEHGMNASTFTARVIASTGADVAAALSGAIGAMSGPLHGGAPARVLPMIEEVERTGDARAVVKGILDRNEKLMGFGHRVYRAEDPRARVLRATAKRLEAPRYEVAAALEQAALAELRERRPDRAIETNVEFWAAVILDFAEVPAKMMPAMFTCGRTAGWCAHILEQKRLGKLVRPAAIYVGPAPAQPGVRRGLGRDRQAVTDRRRYSLRAARAFADLVRARSRSRRWDGPGLGEWDLRALVGHTSRSLITVSTYLQTTAEREDVASPQDYYALIRDSAWIAGAAGDRRARSAGRPRSRRRSRRRRRRVGRTRAGRRGRRRGPADHGDRRPRDPAAHLPADPRLRTRGAQPGHRPRHRDCVPAAARDVLDAATTLAARIAVALGDGETVLTALTGRVRAAAVVLGGVTR